MKAIDEAELIINDVLEPPPDLTVSEWADAERRLSSESSAEPGRWRTDRAPYQKEMLDSLNDNKVQKIVIMSSAQVGKTEIVNNILGYFIDVDPCPILLVNPTLEMSQNYSKTRLAPMCRDTPALTKKISDVKSRSAGNTMLQKSFTGGSLALSGANSPASLASRPVRLLLMDEVDRFPTNLSEGDPVNLAIKRTTAFWNRKIVMVSTPTIKDISRIELAYKDSTQEKYNLKCPSCGDYQQIKREHLQHTYTDEKLTEVKAHCESCGVIHSEHEWKSTQGQWIAGAEHQDTRGFHLNEYVSPWRKWLEIELDFLEAKKSTETLKTFVNTSLGETWEEQGETVDPTGLLSRLEHYDKHDQIRVTTIGIDVQKDRVELEYIGWGEGKESWPLDYIVIPGDTARPEVWDDLKDVLQQLGADVVCIDSGYNTSFVYAFVNKYKRLNLFAIKGQAGSGYSIIEDRKKRALRIRSSRRSGFKPEIIGVDQAKTIVFSQLKISEPGQGYCHFRNNGSFDAEYFDQLTGEKLVTVRKNGRPTLIWKAMRPRVEALDCRVYNLAALEIKLQSNPRALEEKPEIKKEVKKEQTPGQKAVTQHKQKINRSRRKGGFVGGWK
ncbi:MAG: phage terminase large subunit family protein [Gammaproteobacteria bacterium]|nr:phage terminase large subunit family protein [Gammaproteobacteria bacterium]